MTDTQSIVAQAEDYLRLAGFVESKIERAESNRAFLYELHEVIPERGRPREENRWDCQIYSKDRQVAESVADLFIAGARNAPTIIRTLLERIAALEVDAAVVSNLRAACAHLKACQLAADALKPEWGCEPTMEYRLRQIDLKLAQEAYLEPETAFFAAIDADKENGS